MDPTGCPPGYATDRLLYPSHAFQECNEPLVAYWVTVSLSLLFRVLITILQLRIALYFRQVALSNKKQTRIPLTTLAELVYTLLSIPTYILIGFNIINSKDGCSIALLFLGPSFFMVSYFLSCLKLVHLGDKVIPKAIRNEITNQRGVSSITESKNLSSIRNDLILSILYYVSLISLFFVVLFGVILGGIVFKGTQHVYIALGLGFLSLMNITTTSIIFRQTSRVVNYIRGVNQKQKHLFGEQESKTQGDGGKKVEEVIKRLHLRAYMIGLGEFGGVFLHAVGVFTPLPWTIIIAIFTSSSIGALGSTLMYKPKSMRIFGFNKASSMSSANKNNNNELISDPGNRNIGIVSNPRNDVNNSNMAGGTKDSSAVLPIV